MKTKKLLLVLILIGVIIIIINCKKEDKSPKIEYSSIKDLDSNIYKTVKIGNQWWMAENLKTTKYNDGKSIPLLSDDTAWSKLTTLGYCWYNNNVDSYKVTYGALYNWYTVNTGKLCPQGWHIPTHDEWSILTTYLGGEYIAGMKLKESGTAHWRPPNYGTTNETGFTALPGGYRSDFGSFNYIGSNGYWWSSTESSITNAHYRYMYYFNRIVYNYEYYKKIGFSVRCVKD